MSDSGQIVPTTRPLDPRLVEALKRLRPGGRIKITQTVRVGRLTWPAEVTGTYRGQSALATGLATDRVREDDVVVPVVHFTKDNGELSSVSLDENTQISLL